MKRCTLLRRWGEIGRVMRSSRQVRGPSRSLRWCRRCRTLARAKRYALAGGMPALDRHAWCIVSVQLRTGLKWRAFPAPDETRRLGAEARRNGRWDAVVAQNWRGFEPA